MAAASAVAGAWRGKEGSWNRLKKRTMVTHMTIEAAGQNVSAVGWKCNEHCAGVPRKKENAELPLEGL